MWIYKITNEINNKIYIGQTVRSIERRWSGHKWEALNSQKYALHRAMHKHGIENFKIEILAETDSKEDLDRLEKKYIKEYNSFVNQNGYNMTEGGEGSIPTEEARLNMSMAKKGRKLSEEHIAKMRAALKGKKLSEEHKAKTSATLKGRSRPEETKAKISAAHKGKKLSEEHRKKLSKIYTDRPKVICPHCPKSGSQSIMARWHFDNCKLKPQG